MTKKELYAIPVPPAPELGLPDHREADTPKYKRYHRIYAARMVEGLLEITGYTSSGAPMWRTWQDGGRVIGQTLTGDPEPSEKTIASRKREDHWGAQWHALPETDALIRQQAMRDHGSIPKEMTGLDLAEWAQTKTRHKKRDARWDRIRREIDNEMMEIREPPKDFGRWLVREVFRDAHYLIYHYRKGKRKTTAFCTRCGKTVTIRDPRNRKPGRCPSCHIDATCISKNSLAQTNGYIKRKHAAYLQPTRAGFCLRVFTARFVVEGGNCQEDSICKIEWQEWERRFYDLALGRYVKYFEWKEFESSGETRWCRGVQDQISTAMVYPKNLKKLFAETAWRYVPMAELAKQCGPLALQGFVERTRGDLGIEHLAKHGLWNLARDYINYRNTASIAGARNIREAMDGLPMDEIRMLMKIDPATKDYELYKTARDFQRVTPEMLAQMSAMGLDRDRGQALKAILHQTTWRRAARYIQEQQGRWPAENRYDPERRRYRDMPPSPLEVAREWRDYMVDAILLEWDMKDSFILFPNDLRAAHRQTIRELQDRKDQRLTQEILPVLEGQKGFGWKAEGYLIRPPVSAGEITAEGRALHHCVGRYIESVAKGRTIILFVRKEDDPEEPLVTVEIAPESWSIRQARGKDNSAPPEEVKQFLEKWQKHLERVLKKRERKAG